MNILQKSTHYFTAALSVLLSFGVFAHDTRIEHIYTTTLGTGAAHAYAEPEQQTPQRSVEDMRGGQHTHTNYSPLRATLENSFTYQSPSLAPRRDSHHKQLLRTLEMGGRHAFDNANLPIIF